MTDNLDKIDKYILKLLIKYKNQLLTINQIATKIKVSPVTAKRHLAKLYKEGYIIAFKEGKSRKYRRKNGKKDN